MPSEGDERVVYTGAGLFTEVATGRHVFVDFTYQRGDGGGMVMQMTRRDGVEAVPWPLSPAQVCLIAAFFFPDDAGDGYPSQVVRDPVNIDGSPRNKLRDRLRRIRSSENVAALWLVTTLSAFCLHS